MDPIGTIVRAYEEGHRALFITGRSVYDLVVAPDGKIRTLLEQLRRTLRESHGMVLVQYSLAGGLDWDEQRIPEERDRRTIRNALSSHQLDGSLGDHDEVLRVIRGVSSLSRTPTEGLRWANGASMGFAFLLEFAEHLVGGGLANGTQTDQQSIAVELAYLTSQSLALRASGHLIAFHGREGLVDELVSASLHHVALPQPREQEKLDFFAAAHPLYPYAHLESGLTLEGAAHLAANTPNRGLADLLRASHLGGRPLSAADFAEQKSQDVVALSEGTLTVLDTGEGDAIVLSGRTIQTAMRVLDDYAERLARGDRASAANVALVGPPGTGKTQLAKNTARKARVAAYQMHSPKRGIVGETERLAGLQQRVLKEWAPNIAFADEITEAFPTQRGDFDGDSGASRAVMAAMLSALSDESRRGASLLIACTNVPWRMSAAMRSRFIVVPVLFPTSDDFPGIILAVAGEVGRLDDVQADDPTVLEAAEVFYQKGASPRDIRNALSHAALGGTVTGDTIAYAANDFIGSFDRVSTIYADLWAVKACTHYSFFPWNDAPGAYPFPAHLDGVVDRATGAINREELDRRIREYEPYANV